MNQDLKYSININKIDYNLNDLEQLIWKKLLNGSVKKKNGFRTMCVGTIGKNSESMLRVVVNRKVDELNKKIFFHTDVRSRKFFDLQNDNRVSLLFYDARQSIQIAIKAKVIIHTNNHISLDRWKATSPQARLGYMTIDAPNTKSETTTLGYDERFATIKPTEIESDLFKENFAVIECQAHEVEFLYLNYLGNRKANFYYKEGVLIESFWAVP